MPSIYALKPAFQNLLRPLVGALARMGITANQVTILACLLSAACGGLLFVRGRELWPFLLVPVLLFVRMALNAIDGMLAREHGMKSDLGTFLNELGDVISDSALYLGFTSVLSVWPVNVFVLLSAISEMTGVVAVQAGKSRRYDGPMGKSDRAFVFGVLALFIFFLGGRAELDYVVWIASLLVVITVVQRVRKALAET